MTLLALTACQALPPTISQPAAVAPTAAERPSFRTQASDHTDVDPQRVVLSLEPGAAMPDGYRLIRRLAGGGDLLVTASFLHSKASVLSAVSKLTDSPGVAAARTVRTFHIFGTPNDPDYPQQWGMAKVMAASAWDQSTGEKNPVTVAVIDTGIDLTHPDLAPHLVAGSDFIKATDQGRDGNGHGTHVAGIIGAVANNAQGVAGVNWGARLMPIRVMSSDGSGADVDIADGIRWAGDHDAKILNMSLGGYQNDPEITKAIQEVIAKGCLVIAAMGNDGSEEPAYPAATPGVMAVGATGREDLVASFSNSGKWMSVTAPGVGIFSTMPTYETKIPHKKAYGKLSGTSMAAPLVAGLASLVWSKHPDWTAQQVQQRIEQSADDLGTAGRDDSTGYGRINAARALAD